MAKGPGKKKRAPTKKADSARALQKAAEEQAAQTFELRLFVTGATRQSVNAIRTIKKICEEYLPHRHTLEIVDVYQQPSLAASEHIVAAPTLIKRLPAPLRRLVGDMSNQERVLECLGLKSKRQE